ncbi:hypothetical protein FSP39_006606 [Pinctada imbricata]|uniref:Uncharacterized protein n=1 Tax=Pinctada imbricata TaxID=66713 RepID=A0AA89C6S5_PINIB|nr:hypothetical protein FSP39_006606 [Pinctada imbricata]
MYSFGPSSDVTFCQDIETKEFMEREFEDHYNQIRINDLKDMSKSELVDKLLNMEKQAQDLENQLDSSPDRLVKSLQHSGNGMIQSLQKEIEELRTENSRLKELLYS